LTIDTEDSDTHDVQLHNSTGDSEADDKSDTINELVIDLWTFQGQDLLKLKTESNYLQPIVNWLEERVLPESDSEARRVILLAECELPRLPLFSLQISYLNGSHGNVKKICKTVVENLLRHLLTYLAHNYT